MQEPSTLHVISPLTWVSNEFTSLNARLHPPRYQLHTHHGLSPLQDIGKTDGVWIAPELLVALNAWRTRHGASDLQLATPRTDWAEHVQQHLLGRACIAADVGTIRRWSDYPSALGSRPWSGLRQGRITGFRAARRTLNELQHDLSPAPAESVIELNGHVASIREEWCVLVHAGRAVAASGYCVHHPTGSIGLAERTSQEQSVTTVFDGARFHMSYRDTALQAAEQAAQAAHIGTASMIVAFSSNALDQLSSRPSKPVILEVNPVWCTAPYPFEAGSSRDISERLAEGATVFLDSIMSASTATTHINTIPPDDLDSTYRPDPWMSATHRRRYASFQ